MFSDYKRHIDEGKQLPEEWYVLGIDLGTTNSVISYWQAQASRPEPIDISNGFGKIPLPSVVQYREDEDEWVIGEEAYRSMKLYPETTIRSIKRKMGTNQKTKLGGKDYLPEEISAMILKELVANVTAINPKAEIAGLVVSVPYDFDDAAKKATMRACELAGLSEQLICLIEEPKAALLAYNFRHKLSHGEKILVFDFGGGTLDITIFEVFDNGDVIKLQVISEGGEAYHGGDNVDDIIFDKCSEFIKKRTGSNISDFAPENQAELYMRSREAKERLSGIKTFRIPFTFVIPPFVENMSREQFEEIVAPFAEKTRRLVLKALREAYTGALTPDDIDRVILEGGSSQMCWVKDMLNSVFNDESKIYSSERPALDISLGATYYAAMKMNLLNHADMQTEATAVEFEVTVPHDIGLEINNAGKRSFFTMIRRGTPYSLAKRKHVFTLTGNTPSDMTRFDLRILERIDQKDTIENCKLIGDVLITGLPERPSGKTRLEITLLAEEEGGLIKGSVCDLESDYITRFEPDRFKKTEIKQ